MLLHWAWSYLTWDRGPRLILGADIPGVPAGDTGGAGRSGTEGPGDGPASGGAAA